MRLHALIAYFIIILNCLCLRLSCLGWGVSPEFRRSTWRRLVTYLSHLNVTYGSHFFRSIYVIISRFPLVFVSFTTPAILHCCCTSIFGIISIRASLVLYLLSKSSVLFFQYLHKSYSCFMVVLLLDKGF